MAARLAAEWLAICGGCEVSILDLGDPLLDVLARVEIVHMPVLMDHKLFGQTGERTSMEIPEADVGLISGSVRNDEHRLVAEEMRRKCKVLVSVGSCACTGGIPALANQYANADVLRKVYQESRSNEGNRIPDDDIPDLTDRVYAVSEIVPVDISLPGCPTTSETLGRALMALLDGTPLTLPGKSVCDSCPTHREKKAISELRRNLEQPQFTPGSPLSEMRCLMEQGFLCLGPVTRAGCGGDLGPPRCIRAYMPCEGCFGPVTDGADQMVDMIGALASVGVDCSRIDDRPATFNRFTGAGRLDRVKRGVA